MTSDQLAAALDSFLEAASVAQKWRTVGPLERRLRRALGRAFRAQGRRLVDKAAPLAEAAPGARPLREMLTDEEWLALFDQAAAETLGLFRVPLEDAVTRALQRGADAIAADLVSGAPGGFALEWTIENPRAVAYIHEHGAALVSRINETTREQLRGILEQAAQEGWGYGRTATEIKRRYREFAVGVPQQHLRSRAELVAVTEVGNAYEEGTAQIVGGLGFATEKAWLTVGDNRVSDGCRLNEAAGWIPSTELFPSGHMQPLRFPGCRCTCGYRVAQEPK